MRHYLLLLLLPAALLAGCTGLRIAYPQADILLGWRANTYFDLDAAQRSEFSARLDRLLAWHRHEQLPEYATFLTAAIDKAAHGLKAQEIAWFIDGFKARYRVIVNRGAGDAAEILATLTPEQLVALQTQFAKVNRKFADENELEESIEKRKRARLKKTLSQIEDWTGSLGDEQEVKIAALLDALPVIAHLHHRDRMRRQREFVELLKMRQQKPEFAGRLQQWLLGWENGRAADYAQLYSEVFERRIHFYIAVDKLLTQEQRQTALQRLRKYADDCKTLSARPPARTGAGAAAAAILAFY